MMRIITFALVWSTASTIFILNALLNVFTEELFSEARLIFANGRGSGCSSQKISVT